jgi:branched-chain amino acid transport system permease protein
MIFVFAGGVAGLGGALVGPFERSVFPEIAYWTTSGEAAFMSILGGIYNFSGPFIGAIILQLLQNIIRSYTEYWSIIVGGTLILIVIFLPGGIAGFLHTFYDNFIMKRRTHEGKDSGNSGT